VKIGILRALLECSNLGKAVEGLGDIFAPVTEPESQLVDYKKALAILFVSMKGRAKKSVV